MVRSMEIGIISTIFKVKTFALGLGTLWPTARQLSGTFAGYEGILLLYTEGV